MDKPSGNRPPHGPLDSQVELVRPGSEDRRLDSVDPDLEPHVRPYLQRLFTQLKTPSIDLTTPESARESMKTLEVTLNEINSALHRTRSLRMQLEQKRGRNRG